MFFEPVNIDLGLTESDVNQNTLKLLEKYDEGYQIGLTWPDNWETHGKPGGPWVYTYNSLDKQIRPDYVEKAKQSAKENSAWRLGWENGHKEKWRMRNV